MKKVLLSTVCFGIISFSSVSQGAFVDYGLTLGTFNNSGTVVPSGSGLFELGVFSGYNDTLGTAFFTGKDYSTLRSSWTSFPDSITSIDGTGGFYKTVDLLSTPVGTRLFAWGFSTAPASPSANWTIISGTIGDAGTYGPAWLAVAPADITVNSIEVGTLNNFMYANSNPGNAFQANSVAPSELSANVNVVPEPSTYALLTLAGIGVGGYMLRKRSQA